jgi:hypothetical protein
MKMFVYKNDDFIGMLFFDIIVVSCRLWLFLFAEWGQRSG